MTAYDLSLGAPLPNAEEHKFYMDYLRAVADWRTNWKRLKKNRKDDPAAAMFMDYYSTEKTSGAVELATQTLIYYSSGNLPSDFAKSGVTELQKLRLIVSQTVRERKQGQSID